MAHQSAKNAKLSLLYQWRALDTNIEYPNEKAKSEAIASKKYIPKNVILLDADYHSKC